MQYSQWYERYKFQLEVNSKHKDQTLTFIEMELIDLSETLQIHLGTDNKHTIGDRVGRFT